MPGLGSKKFSRLDATYTLRAQKATFSLTLKIEKPLRGTRHREWTNDTYTVT
jgi:hypothetical protein